MLPMQSFESIIQEHVELLKEQLAGYLKPTGSEKLDGQRRDAAGQAKRTIRRDVVDHFAEINTEIALQLPSIVAALSKPASKHCEINLEEFCALVDNRLPARLAKAVEPRFKAEG